MKTFFLSLLLLLTIHLKVATVVVEAQANTLVNDDSTVSRHTVVSGDTLWGLSNTFKVSVADLKSWNNLDSDLIFVGQELIVSDPDGTTDDTAGETADGTMTYTVVAGDYLYKIAMQFGVSVEDLKRWNSLESNLIVEGQTLIVSSNGRKTMVFGYDDSSSSEVSSSLITQEEFNSVFKALGREDDLSTDEFTYYSQYALSVGKISSRVEAAMFLTQVAWESDLLRATAEYACTGNNSCEDSYRLESDYPGQHYYGRGYIQLSWEYNYRAASTALYGDDTLLKNPDLVTEKKDAWRTAFWYWANNVHVMPDVLLGKFGASTRAINGALECDGEFQQKARSRFANYQIVYAVLGLEGSPIEAGCYN